MCMNELYSYQTYCPTDFQKIRKFIYLSDRRDREIWNQDELDVINMRKNYMGLGIICLFRKFT